ncbi:ABC transporter ATP-binding protein [Aureliella helgolandensis]|uniref:Putative ABC transporter ATP-binding protein YxlF n=1 Tax=Aureliella helgolandensis TaxID=2527968 RepID=A0A518GGC7_9BACT|nr:ABC transporter ATP-binding protein [Aureliella helgolandensis]QDV27646.1 putative ABC transporter ATP-binding protein YxlF [Aureliella helgolandensis]
MTDAPAIDVRQIHKRYHDGWFARKSFLALRGVDLTVRRGEAFGLLGPNGAGKTTLIKILLGIVRSTGGAAFLLGHPAGSRGARQRVGYLPENLNFPAHHTALQALRFYGRLNSLDEAVIRSRSRDLLDLVGLVGRETELVRKYSKGMRQRLGLAQAMLHEPELLILDEPTDGLDPVGRSEIRRIITRLKNQGKTVFLNSHILQEVELVCDRVAILATGKLRGVGTPSELTTQFHGALSARLCIEVSGAPEVLEQIGPQLDAELQPLPDGRWQLTAHADSQSDVDRTVDRLRSSNLSIHKLERKRPTLEEVFLSAVNTQDDALLPSSEPAHN